MKSYKLDDYEGEITNVFLEKLTIKLNERQKVFISIFWNTNEIVKLIEKNLFSVEKWWIYDGTKIHTTI